MTPNEQLRLKIKKSGLTRKEFVEKQPAFEIIVEKKLTLEMLNNWLYANRPIPLEWVDRFKLQQIL